MLVARQRLYSSGGRLCVCTCDGCSAVHMTCGECIDRPALLVKACTRRTQLQGASPGCNHRRQHCWLFCTPRRLDSLQCLITKPSVCPAAARVCVCLVTELRIPPDNCAVLPKQGHLARLLLYLSLAAIASPGGVYVPFRFWAACGLRHHVSLLQPCECVPCCVCRAGL